MPYQRQPKLTLNTNDETGNLLTFRLENTDVSVANAIRRTMIAEVPTMAITLVTVIENTSALADEYIVHRLGLIPLHSENINNYVFPQDCESCDSQCAKCSVLYNLNVTCLEETKTVTSRDLLHDNLSMDNEALQVTPVHNSGDIGDHHSKPAVLIDVQQRVRQQHNDGIVIVRLSKGQKISMKCLIRKGIGKDHAKHSPMCTVSYRIFPPPVELNLDRINLLFSSEMKKTLMDMSSGLLGMDEQSGNLKYEQPFLRGRIAVHPDTCRKAGELAVLSGGKADEVVLNHEAKYFDFFAETTGAMTPRQALEMALDILDKKAGNVLAHLNT